MCKTHDALCIKGMANNGLKVLSEIADCFSADTWAAGFFLFTNATCKWLIFQAKPKPGR